MLLNFIFMKRISIIAVLALVLVTAFSCCPCRKTASAGAMNLDSTTWQLSQINGRNITAQEDQYTIHFGEDGVMSGVAMCNKLTGSYNLGESKSLKFDHVGMTRMMCPSPEFEDEYGQMLGKITHYVMDGGMMIMLSEGESIAVFKML